MNPYRHLQERCRKWASPIAFPFVKAMFGTLPKAKLAGGYNLDDIYERTMAAQDLGFEVRVVANEEGLRFEYVTKRPTSIPVWM